MVTNQLTMSVILCTYRRPDDLLRCLDALDRQSTLPAEVLVVVRDTDLDSRTALARRPSGKVTVRIVPVAKPGLIAARCAGLDACKTDLAAMTDDDAVPHADWLERMVHHFVRDDRVAGVGGRDRCLVDGRWQSAREHRVGRIQWFGRMIGAHHLGLGPARNVQILKGVNMGYRVAAVGSLRPDPRLRGQGAQPHEDSMFCVALRAKGFRLVYDPAILVDHYEGEREEPRHYAAMLPVEEPRAFCDVAFNWALVISTEFSAARLLVFLLWNLLIGTRVGPGLLQAIRFTPALGRASWRRFWLTQVGTYECCKMLGKGLWQRMESTPGMRAAGSPAGTEQVS